MSGELDWIVMKALDKDRNRRYETASAFAADVQRALNDEPVHACPPSALYRLRKFARRHRTALSLAGLVLFFIVSIGVGAGWVVRDRVAREQEIDHDRTVREETLDREVERLLDGSGPLIEQGKWPEALAEVERADKLLELAGRTVRPPRMLDLRQELTMANHLEEIYPRTAARREVRRQRARRGRARVLLGSEPGFAFCPRFSGVGPRRRCS